VVEPYSDGTHEAGWQLRQVACVTKGKSFGARPSQQAVYQYLVKARSSSSLATNPSPLMFAGCGLQGSCHPAADPVVGALAAKLLDWCSESGDVCPVVKIGASSDHCSTPKWAAEQ
jgi:hypothetical protein